MFSVCLGVEQFVFYLLHWPVFVAVVCVGSFQLQGHLSLSEFLLGYFDWGDASCSWLGQICVDVGTHVDLICSGWDELAVFVFGDEWASYSCFSFELFSSSFSEFDFVFLWLWSILFELVEVFIVWVVGTSACFWLTFVFEGSAIIEVIHGHMLEFLIYECVIFVLFLMFRVRFFIEAFFEMKFKRWEWAVVIIVLFVIGVHGINNVDWVYNGRYLRCLAYKNIFSFTILCLRWFRDILMSLWK